MIYFDNAATGGRKPDSVITAVTSALKACANPGRSGHKLSLSCLGIVQECRNALSEYFDGYGFERVAFTKNCTEALNLALFGTLGKGDHAIATAMEHNSVLRPLERLKNERRVEYDICPLSTNESWARTIDPSAVKKLLKPNTKAVIVTSCSNVNGAIPNLYAIKKAIPKNVLLIVDGAQGGGHISLKMKGAGIDLLALAGHKGLFATQGSGALLFSERVELPPLLYGGTGTLSFSLDMPEFYPDNLEAGTLSFPAIYSLLEGIRYLSAHEKQISAKLKELAEYFLAGLKKLPVYQIYSTANESGIVAFAHENLQSEFIASLLSSKYDIAVRGGLHCAPFMHEALGTQDGGLVRVSFSHFNTKTEIDELLLALKKIAENGGFGD